MCDLKSNNFKSALFKNSKSLLKLINRFKIQGELVCIDRDKKFTTRSSAIPCARLRANAANEMVHEIFSLLFGKNMNIFENSKTLFMFSRGLKVFFVETLTITFSRL